jgi:hypothetical protein
MLLNSSGTRHSHRSSAHTLKSRPAPCREWIRVGIRIVNSPRKNQFTNEAVPEIGDTKTSPLGAGSDRADRVGLITVDGVADRYM